VQPATHDFALQTSPFGQSPSFRHGTHVWLLVSQTPPLALPPSAPASPAAQSALELHPGACASPPLLPLSLPLLPLSLPLPLPLLLPLLPLSLPLLLPLPLEVASPPLLPVAASSPVEL
jgi:hypothetical protein